MAIQENNDLAVAIETGDVSKIRTCIMMQQMNSHKVKWTKETEKAALFANPDSAEVRTRAFLLFFLAAVCAYVALGPHAMNCRGRNVDIRFILFWAKVCPERGRALRDSLFAALRADKDEWSC